MRAFFINEIGNDRYRVVYGNCTVEGKLELITQIVAETVTEHCHNMKDDVMRFELAAVLPPVALANAIYELECVTKAKEAFFRACIDKASLREKKEMFDNYVTAATTLNLDNIWLALGVGQDMREEEAA